MIMKKGENTWRTSYGQDTCKWSEKLERLSSIRIVHKRRQLDQLYKKEPVDAKRGRKSNFVPTLRSTVNCSFNDNRED